jgi:hypothetical protein
LCGLRASCSTRRATWAFNSPPIMPIAVSASVVVACRAGAYPLRAPRTRPAQAGGGREGDDEVMADKHGGWWHRLMFSIMGPAQVGPYGTAVPPPDESVCPRCSQRWEQHEQVRTSTRSYRRCPER